MTEVMGHQWAYVNGEVQFGETYAVAAHKAALKAGLGETVAQRVRNLVTVHALPNDLDVAIGIIRNGRPQIWQSTTDRTHVYVSVREEYGEINASRDNGSDVQRQDNGLTTSRPDEYNRWS